MLKHESYQHLLEAIWSEDARNVQELLDQGAWVHARGDVDGRPILMMAPTVEMTRLFLEHGADPNATSKVGETALIRAARLGRLDVVKLLLDFGADPTHKPLLVSDMDLFISGNENTWDRRCVAYTALSDLGISLPDRATALVEAAAGGNLEIVRLLLDNGSSLEERDNTGCSALLRAAANLGFPVKTSYLQMINFLLERGADPNVSSCGSFTTPLRAAVAWGSVDAVQLLLLAGADPHFSDLEGHSILNSVAYLSSAHLSMGPITELSLLNASCAVAKLLLEAGADVNALDEKGGSPLRSAIVVGNIPLARVFLEWGADPSMAEVAGSLVQAAEERGLHEMVTFLREQLGGH